MILKFKNNKNYPQQIMSIKGTAINVMPGEVYDLDEDLVYKEELERAKKFFEVKKTVPEKKPERIVEKKAKREEKASSLLRDAEPDETIIEEEKEDGLWRKSTT